MPRKPVYVDPEFRRIIERMRQKYGSYRAMATLADIPHDTFNKLVNGDGGIDPLTVRRIAGAFGEAEHFSEADVLRWLDKPVPDEPPRGARAEPSRVRPEVAASFRDAYAALDAPDFDAYGAAMASYGDWLLEEFRAGRLGARRPAAGGPGDVPDSR